MHRLRYIPERVKRYCTAKQIETELDRTIYTLTKRVWLNAKEKKKKKKVNHKAISYLTPNSFITYAHNIERGWWIYKRFETLVRISETFDSSSKQLPTGDLMAPLTPRRLNRRRQSFLRPSSGPSKLPNILQRETLSLSATFECVWAIESLWTTGGRRATGHAFETKNEYFR